MSSFSIVNSFLHADLLAFLRWWRTNFFAKLILIFAFLGLFTLISFAIYAGTFTFLTPLTTTESFGLRTSQYLVHVSVLITLWLGVASSFVSFLSFLLSPDPSLDFRIGLPVEPKLIVFHTALKNLFSSLIWSLFIFLPMGLVVLRLFGGGTTFSGILTIILLITVLVTISLILGSLLATLYGLFFRPFHSTYLTLALTLLFIFSTVYLIKLILPVQLGSLIGATPDQFNLIFNSLPLNQSFLPTYYLANLLYLPSLMPTLLIFISLLFTAVFSTSFIGRVLISIRQKVLVRPKTNTLSASFDSQKKELTIFDKDILSVLRSPSELGYALFLLGLTLGFFYFFSISSRQAPVYGVVWFLFYLTAFCLRLIFPLMAKEGRSAWFIFTKPVSSASILNQKLISSFAIGLPFFVIAVFVALWSGQPFVTLAGFIGITLFSSLLGNIFPNFHDSADPERASTSFMGFLALFLSLLLIITFSRPVFTTTGFAAAAIICIILYFLGLTSVKRYHF